MDKAILNKASGKAYREVAIMSLIMLALFGVVLIIIAAEAIIIYTISTSGWK